MPVALHEGGRDQGDAHEHGADVQDQSAREMVRQVCYYGGDEHGAGDAQAADEGVLQGRHVGEDVVGEVVG